MIEAAIISETSVSIYQSARRNIPENSHLHTCSRENLKSLQKFLSSRGNVFTDPQIKFQRHTVYIILFLVLFVCAEPSDSQFGCKQRNRAPVAGCRLLYSEWQTRHQNSERQPVSCEATGRMRRRWRRLSVKETDWSDMLTVLDVSRRHLRRRKDKCTKISILPITLTRAWSNKELEIFPTGCVIGAGVVQSV
jgi:hypothetical protein